MAKHKLEEICEIQKGKVPISKAVEGEYPLVTTAEQRGTHSEYHFDKESVIIPMVSSTGHGHASIKRLHIQDGKFAVGNILAVLTPKDDAQVLAKYLYAYLSFHKEGKLVSLMKGSANVSLTLAKLKGVEVEIPTLSLQERVIEFVDYISALESEINLLQDDASKLFNIGLKELFENE